MDYYVVINGQKQGPYDILGFIKKVKNGLITGDTQVSTTEKGPFRPASEVEELKSIIKAETGFKASMGKDISVSLDHVLNEGAELWTRRVAEYTIFFGLIVIVGYGLSTILRDVQFLADYPFIITYITSVVSFTLLGFYCYYILMTKRSQDPDLKEIKVVVKSSFSSLIIFSVFISLATLPVGVKIILTTVTLGVASLILSMLIFVPFLVVDHRMGLKRAIKASLEAFWSVGAGIKLCIIAIVVINVVAVFLPGILANIIFFLGIIITLPVSISVIANIYDHILT